LGFGVWDLGFGTQFPMFLVLKQLFIPRTTAGFYPPAPKAREPGYRTLALTKKEEKKKNHP